MDYSYIDRDELRSGGGSATPWQVVDRPSESALGGGEIEKQTINRYLDLGVSYRPNSDWGVAIILPWA